MAQARRCNHTVLYRGCHDCKRLQKEWYGKLEGQGFHDIEYGLENPRFIVAQVDPQAPNLEESRAYYEAIWQVYHAWVAAKRSARDCRLAELLAAQEGDTGTVRGISRVLRSESLRPWSTAKIQVTIKEIRLIASEFYTITID